MARRGAYADLWQRHGAESAAAAVAGGAVGGPPPGARRPRHDGPLPVRRADLALSQLAARLPAARARRLVRRGRRHVAVRPASPTRSADDPAYAARYLHRTAVAPSGWATAGPTGRSTGAGRSATGCRSAACAISTGDCDALLNLCGATVLNDDHALAAPAGLRRDRPGHQPAGARDRRAKTRAVLAAHDTIVTYGENYGAPDCGVPLPPGIRYLKTRQPIDLELWPMAFDPAAARYTTIGNWKQPGHDVDLARRDLPLEQAPRVPEVPRPAPAPAPATLRALR